MKYDYLVVGAGLYLSLIHICSSIANITAALIGAKDKQAKEKNAEVIAKLEEIIDTLKNDEE